MSLKNGFLSQKIYFANGRLILFAYRRLSWNSLQEGYFVVCGEDNILGGRTCLP